MLVECVFPEVLQASAAMKAAKREDVFGSGLRPEHAGLFEPAPDDALASGLDHAATNKPKFGDRNHRLQ